MSKWNENRPGYKKTKFGWLPKEWETPQINDVGQVQAGRQRSPHFTNGDLRPYLRVANIFAGYIDTSDVLEMRFTEAEFEKFCLQYSDILLNEGQSLKLVGRCALYRGVPKDCCFQNTLVRFRSDGSIIPNFALILFTYFQKTGVFASIASQTTSIAHLGVSRFASLPIPLPSLPEK